MYNISTRLSSHIKGAKEKKEFITRIYENRDLFERLSVLLELDLKKSRNQQIDRESFRNPEWANQVAFEFGYQKALEDIINLITIRIKDG